MKAKASIFVISTLFSFLAFTQSKKTEDSILSFNDILYVEKGLIKNDSLQRLNLTIPKFSDNFPLLIWIGGGAWSYGDRNEEMALSQKLAKEGIAVASVGHRLSPAIWRNPKMHHGIQHPKHVQDVAMAVKWLYDNSSTYGFDLNKIFIGGYSSGAHLAALVSLDGSYLRAHGLSTEIFKGILPISGTYDIPNYHKVFLNGANPELAKQHVEAVFGSSQKHMRNASPVTYLENLSAPILLISDNSLYRYTNLFEKELRKVSFEKVQVIYSHDLSHGELWKNLSFDKHSNYRNIIIDFIYNQNL